MQGTFCAWEKGEGGIWTAAPSHPHAAIIAAAATANNAVTIPIDECPDSEVRKPLLHTHIAARKITVSKITIGKTTWRPIVCLL